MHRSEGPAENGPDCSASPRPCPTFHDHAFDFSRTRNVQDGSEGTWNSLQDEKKPKTQLNSFCIHYLRVQKQFQSQHLLYSLSTVTSDHTTVAQAFGLGPEEERSQLGGIGTSINRQCWQPGKQPGSGASCMFPEMGLPPAPLWEESLTVELAALLDCLSTFISPEESQETSVLLCISRNQNNFANWIYLGLCSGSKQTNETGALIFKVFGMDPRLGQL